MGKEESKMQNLTPRDLTDLKKNTEFNEEELQKWYEVFAQHSDGKLTIKQFQEIYSKKFPNGDANQFAEYVFKTYDADGDGYVDFREFMIGLSTTSRGTPEQKLRWYFNMYDQDGNGVITRDEMYKIVCALFKMAEVEKLRLPPEDDTPQKLTRNIFKKLDRDQSGSIEINEFVNGAKCYPSIFRLLEAGSK